MSIFFLFFLCFRYIITKYMKGERFMANISKDDVIHIAKLSNLNISDNEV